MNKIFGVCGVAGVIVWAGLAVTVGVHASGAAPVATSVRDGVYTKAQAVRGKQVYDASCASCHGDDLLGMGPMPAVAGKDFLRRWQGKTVAELFAKAHDTMPMTAPGSLTEQQSADILAYTFSMDKFPAGQEELPHTAQALKAITIDQLAK